MWNKPSDSERIDAVTAWLDAADIAYDLYFHPASPTIELAKRHWRDDGSKHCKNLFFRNAGKVVVEGTSVYDVLSCFTDICCLINNCRWVASSCSDSSLTGGKNCCYNTRAACCSDQRNIFMFHHDIACL